MTSQFFTTYSSHIEGIAILAGGPHFCFAFGQTETFCAPNFEITEQMKYLEGLNEIDSLTSIVDKKVFVWHGQEDTRVVPELGH